MNFSIFTSDRLGASKASLRKQFSIAVGAVRLVILAGEPLASELDIAVGTTEALSVPWVILVSHPTGSDHLVTLDTPGGELLLVAARAVDLLLTGNETLGADRGLADATRKAFLVPLSSLVFHLLRA